jgi:cyclase
VADVAPLLEAGADKVSVNSSAVRNPQLIDDLSKAFGSQCIVLAIDARKVDNQWTVHTHGGKNPTEKKLFTWAKEGQERGAGEILFTSMDHDGTKNGFANDPLLKLHNLLNIPVVASGGAGAMEHFIDVFVLGKADAALAASIFHFGEIMIPDLKSFLCKNNINVRL